MTKEVISKSPSGRTKRTPIAGRNVLTVNGKEPGYVYRVVNDAGDRIAQFLDAGYELVSADSVTVGDKRVNQATAEGSKAQVAVGKGDKAFVMRIKDEYYKEDQAAKQAHVDRLEQSIKQNASSVADYGTLDIRTGQK
jgi:regulator of protease activity HflC (stomatin/prohibitin superfamily)